jgi:hypothetical protein
LRRPLTSCEHLFLLVLPSYISLASKQRLVKSLVHEVPFYLKSLAYYFVLPVQKCIDSSQDKKAKRISGKRTVRGIAKKRRNLNSQNNKSPAEAPLIEVDNEIENRENQIKSPCRSVANSIVFTSWSS